MRKNQANKEGDDKAAGGANAAGGPQGNRKDFSELQKEQMLKQGLVEQLSLEETNLGNFKFEVDKPEQNAILYVKEDVENPIIRLDTVVDYNPRQIYDTLIATDMIH